MMFASVGGSVCSGLFTVVLVIAVTIAFGVRLIKRNEEVRKVAKQAARAAALKATRKWLK